MTHLQETETLSINSIKLHPHLFPPPSRGRIKERGSIHRIRNAGFTLLEVLVVAAIIVIIAGIMIPRMAGHTEKARQNKAKAELAQLASALAMVKLDNPDAVRYCRLEDLDNPTSSPPTRDGDGNLYAVNPFNNWNGPYMIFNDVLGGTSDDVPNDPWGNDYILDVSTVAAQGYAVLKTLGKDGTDGTSDDISHKFM